MIIGLIFIYVYNGSIIALCPFLSLFSYLGTIESVSKIFRKWTFQDLG